ncbi:motile sperm domain-containing protein 2-like [Centruroides sculpturatus]|uniref:motile sperm domain-containing protein 2-like n=1 Tax=Centruroides sculpturatus TaxID=218467 RepID=UPI000C6D2107|nr:motile sperm domain-containing protein 2-like [Centruroides sculpturatus]
MYITEESLTEFKEDIKEIRRILVEDVKTNVPKYNESDVRRILEEDRLALRFLLFKKRKIRDAIDMIKATLAWRKEFGVDKITRESIPPIYFSTNAVVSYKNGDDAILVVKGKDYKKTPGMEETTKKFVVYWLEIADKHSDNGRVTILFDFRDCGLSNLDTEMIKFLINTFTSYYPLCLSHVLVYELPWLLNAAWRLIRSWLPAEAAELIKLVDRETVSEYVDRLVLPADFGGLNKDSVPSPPTLPDKETAASPLTLPEKEPAPKPPNRSPVLVNPPDRLVFSPPPENSLVSPATVVFGISNVSKSCVAFKIKTTSRRRYRAWPFVGLIRPGDRTDINAQLLNGATCQENDKFLIMATEVKSDVNPSELDDVWNSSEITEHRLRCVAASEIPKKDKTTDGNPLDVGAKLEYLENMTLGWHRKQTRILYLCCLILFVHLLLDHKELILSVIDQLYQMCGVP